MDCSCATVSYDSTLFSLERIHDRFTARRVLEYSRIFLLTLFFNTSSSRDTSGPSPPNVAQDDDFMIFFFEELFRF